jgi:hypothetical protein
VQSWIEEVVQSWIEEVVQRSISEVVQRSITEGLDTRYRYTVSGCRSFSHGEFLSYLWLSLTRHLELGAGEKPVILRTTCAPCSQYTLATLYPPRRLESAFTCLTRLRALRLCRSLHGRHRSAHPLLSSLHRTTSTRPQSHRHL